MDVKVINEPMKGMEEILSCLQPDAKNIILASLHSFRHLHLEHLLDSLVCYLSKIHHWLIKQYSP